MNEQAAGAQADTQPSTTLHIWDTELPGAWFRIQDFIEKKIADQLRQQASGRFLTATCIEGMPDSAAVWGFARDEAVLLEMVKLLLGRQRAYGNVLKVKPHLVSASTEAAICALPEWLI